MLSLFSPSAKRPKTKVDYVTLRDELLTIFAEGQYVQEVVNAKKEFFERAGIVDDESYTFESRMEQFLDWYLFSRELSNSHVPPIRMYLESGKFQIDESKRPYFENLANNKHSLFEFVRLRGRDIFVRDLLRGKRVVLFDSEVTAGFNHDEIFEARIIPHEKSFVFARGFCFHPAGAKNFILKEIKKVRHLDSSQQEALMLRLLKMRYKFEQYKHIKLEYIYTNDVTLKI